MEIMAIYSIYTKKVCLLESGEIFYFPKDLEDEEIKVLINAHNEQVIDIEFRQHILEVFDA